MRRKSTLALLVAFVIAVPMAYLGDRAPAVAADAPPAPTPVTHHVTLLTGDTVQYSDSGGGHAAVAVHAAPRPGGAPVVFQTVGGRGSLFVIPSDAQPYLAAGVLDRALFDVAGLVRQRLDDASSDALPVLARFPGKPDRAALSEKSKALPGTERVLPVATRGLVGMKVKRAKVADFWHAVAPRPVTSKAGFDHVTRIALDRTMRVSLEQSVPMVGAPAAWASGLDGSGVTVGVVDTGIDADHPDLAGQVIDTANFTYEPDASDWHGHGTHVASIIAGTGQQRRGVAPGAKLLIAKVFDASGYAPESQIMAGMEWAAMRGAKVINMSLGGAPTDGTDEVSALVNDLTERTGALFVISAGNLGADRGVTSPGAATSALTVGAVDKQGHLATFSSKGPRLGDAAVKPEIVAPGVSIVAARAANTWMGTPVDDFSTTSSGTSMAAPHVAGAAAIVAQQHPGWQAKRLKDGLVSTAHDGGKAWFEQGAGRLDIARAIGSPVTASATLNVGRLFASGTAQATYTNDGDGPVSLRLSAGARGWNDKTPPDGTLRLSTSTLTVPAHGSATVTVTVDPALAEKGVYGGLLAASSDDGTVSLRTPLSWYAPTPHGPITVDMRDSRGQPVTNWFAAVLNESAGHGNDPLGPDPLQFIALGAPAQVPEGKYTVSSTLLESALQSQRWSAMIATEVAVTGSSTSVTLDARATIPVGVRTALPTEQRDRTVALRRHLPGSTLFVEWQFVIGAEANWRVFATPAPAAKVGTVSLQDYVTLSERQLTMRVHNGPWLRPMYDAGNVGSVLAGRRTLELVWAAGGDFTGVAARGKLALVAIGDPGPVANPVLAVNQAAKAAATRAAAAGAAGLVSYVDVAGALPIGGLTHAPLAQLSLGHDEGNALRDRLAAGPVAIDLAGLAAPGFMYNLSFHDDNGIPAEHIKWVDPGKLVMIRSRYHADKPEIRYAKQWTAYPPVPGSLAQRTTTWTGPGEWTEYVGPVHPRVAWQRRTGQTAVDAQGRVIGQLTMFAENVFATGGMRLPEERWFASPLRNGAVILPTDHPVYQPATTAQWWERACGFCRGGSDPDMFVPAMQWMDSGRGHFVTIWQNGLQYFNTTSTRLYHYYSGEEISVDASNPFRTYPAFRLPAGPGRYRLHMVDAFPATQRGGPSLALSRTATRTETTWVFSSRRPSGPVPAGYSCFGNGLCAFQPLVQLDYQIDLGLGNEAPAGRDFTFTVRAGTHPGADGASPAAGLTVRYSTDEGATWKLATVARSAQGQYLVTVKHPPLAGTRGYVWLKANAWDGAGNWVEQTVHRAYALAD